jgi:56kDa selenium binding protein (SBP56)
MPRFLSTIVLVVCATAAFSPAGRPAPARSGHYLFVWVGDQAKKGNDFLVVLDVDPSSASYGHLVTTLATDQQTMRVHHTEYTMPASGMLFANDHDAGRTFIFDVRDPLHPSVETSFTDMAGYMHPHSYVRLPNGHVLATFQHTHHAGGAGPMGESGGLVEIDDRGNVVRSASSADPAFPGALLTPYGLVVMPAIDRVVSTNSSMQEADIFSGVTYQVWRLSDLKLLATSYLDVGKDRYAHISPEEPRLAPDGSVLIQTLGCGLERITGVDASAPKAQLVYGFPGNWCGVPTVVGHYLVQSVPVIHGFIVLDVADAAKPVEVSRITLSDSFFSHWSAWDPETQRLVVTTGSAPPDNRMYLLKLDQTTGAITVDSTFHDADGKPGFSFGARQWPHGWTGAGTPHGAVFSR